MHPVPLDVLPSPLSLSSCLQKQEIVQNDPVNRSSSCCQRWRCCHPKARSVCQPHGSLIFHGLLPMQSRVLIAYGRMANLIFLRGSQRKRVWILAYCQTTPPPLTKGECLECASETLLRPAGRWRGDTEGEQGRSGD